MKLIIGVLIGAYIIFNWGDIREYMDNKVSSISNQKHDDIQVSEEGDMHTEIKINNDNDDPKEKQEKNDDGWSDFR
jgi:hypothetical protein